jgi:hypothetical protein
MKVINVNFQLSITMKIIDPSIISKLRKKMLTFVDTIAETS